MPIYYPKKTAGRLHLKLGYVGTGAMANGSNQITNFSFSARPSWEPQVPPLSLSDVGTQISVIGAGPSPSFKPIYPAGYPGTMLVSTIAGVSGSTITINKAAQNDTQPSAANVTVYREVSTDINTPMKVQWTLTTSSRGTLTATIYDPLGILNVKAGQPIYLYDDNLEGDDASNGDYFGGAIDSVTARNIPGRVPWVGGIGPGNPGNLPPQNPVYWDIQALSWSHLLDRRLVNAFYPPPAPDPNNPLPAPPQPPQNVIPPGFTPIVPYGVAQPGQFVNMFLGDIFNQLIYNYCDSEGLSTSIPDYFGPPIAFLQTNPGKDTIAQALDNAAQAGYSVDITSGQITSYIWLIDAWKKVSLAVAGAQPQLSPWNIDEAGQYGDDASILLSVSNATTREKLCNSVYIDSSQTVGAQIEETYKCDPSKHSYSTGQPIGGIPTVMITGPNPAIEIDGVMTGDFFPKTVCVKGAPVQSADFQWSMGSNSIDQETLGTLQKGIDPNVNDFYVIGGLRIKPPASGIQVQIDDEVMLVQNIDHAGVSPQHWYNVKRGQGLNPYYGALGLAAGGDPNRQIYGFGNNKKHDEGANITLPGFSSNPQQQIKITYQPLTKKLFTSVNTQSVDTQASIEGGKGFWEAQISLGAPFSDQSGTLGPAMASAFVADFGIPPQTFQGETYRSGLAIGQTIYIRLYRPPIDENFLIDQLDFTSQDKRQKWTFHAINGALIGDWRKAFIGLANQFAPLGGGGGGSALTAAPAPLGSPDWAPGMETPNAGASPAGDPLWGASQGFGIAQGYVLNNNGQYEPQLSIYGQQPEGNVPMQFRVRREYVSGVCGQEVMGVSTNTITLGAHTGTGVSTPLVANQFVGRIMSKLANAVGSSINPGAQVSRVPIQDFTITANDALGNFTVVPDPMSLTTPPQQGDLFTIRTGRAAGTSATPNDASATYTTYTDPLWINNYTQGLVPSTDPTGGNMGNVALVIGGTGKGQAAQQVVSNTQNSITVDPGWSTLPDATSVIILVERTPQVDLPPSTTNSASNMIGMLTFSNYTGQPIHVESWLNPGQVEGSLETVAFRELYLWGAQSTRVIDKDNYAAGMFVLDYQLVFDTSGLPPAPTNTLAADVAVDDTNVELVNPYIAPYGTIMQIASEMMMVTGPGTGTNGVTVTRNWSMPGRDASPPPVDPYAAGGTVYQPAGMPWVIVPFSKAPNQHFIFTKAPWSTDIGYVKIQPTTNDPAGIPNQLPDNENATPTSSSFHVLADTSSSHGSYDFRVPAGGSNGGA